MEQSTQTAETRHSEAAPVAVKAPTKVTPQHLFAATDQVMKTLYGSESLWPALDRVSTGIEGAAVLTYMAARGTENAVRLTSESGPLAAWKAALSDPMAESTSTNGIETHVITGSLAARTVTIIASIAGGQPL